MGGAIRAHGVEMVAARSLGCYLIKMLEKALDQPVADAIADVVRSELQGFGVYDVGAAAGFDHDGDPVIFVDVHYKRTESAIDVKAVAALVTKLRDRLWTMGETRFPHVHHHFAAEQRITGS